MYVRIKFTSPRKSKQTGQSRHGLERKCLIFKTKKGNYGYYWTFDKLIVKLNPETEQVLERLLTW